MVDSSTVPSVLIAAGFQALSEPLRLKILELLRSQELCVCDLCDLLHTPQSKLSFHLKVLKDAELVQARQSGRWMYYSINGSQMIALEQHLAQYRSFSQTSPTRVCEN